MKILVTGGTGFIGSHTVVELISQGHEIMVIDNLSNSRLSVIGKIEKITGSSLTFDQVDLLDKRKLNKVFSENTFQAVIHFAGLKSVEESQISPLDYYSNNFNSALNLLEIMDQNNVKKIIFSSSATVYGDNKQTPIKEDSVLSPINPYGRSKMFIEDLLRDIYISDNQWKINILRYFNPIGAHHSGLIGENPKSQNCNLMHLICQCALKRVPVLNIFGNNYPTADGTGVRDYIHIDDLAKGHVASLEILNKSSNHDGFNIFNLGTGNGTSVLELIYAFEKSNGIKINYEFSEKRIGDIAISFADVSKVKKVLKWQAQKDIYDMCKDIWNYQTLN